LKKIVLTGFVLVCFYNLGHATHLFRNSAANLNTGILPNERLDSSSVTLQANTFNGANQLLQADGNGLIDDADVDPSSVTKRGQLTDGLQIITLSSATSYGTLTSSTGFVGVGSTLTALNATNLTLGTIPNARQNSSSVTLQANAFNGASQLLQTGSDGFIEDADVDPSSVTKQGNAFNGASQLLQSQSDGFIDDADVDPSSVTKQGNAFNGASQLLQSQSDGFIDDADMDPSSVTKLGASIIESEITLADNTTNNATTVRHGFLPKLSNVSTQFLDGTGAFSVPASASTGSIMYNLVITTNGSGTNEIVITSLGMNIMSDYYANIATSCFLNINGDGGLDTGSEAASTWYKLFAISNGSTMSVIASSADVSILIGPTMPSGYTKWRFIGHVRNNSSSNIVPTYKIGHIVYYFTAIQLFYAADLSGETLLNMENQVPPGAYKIECNGSGAGSGFRWSFRPADIIVASDAGEYQFGNNLSNVGSIKFDFSRAVNANRTFKYREDNATGEAFVWLQSYEE